jgi:hypothetical protein
VVSAADDNVRRRERDNVDRCGIRRPDNVENRVVIGRVARLVPLPGSEIECTVEPVFGLVFAQRCVVRCVHQQPDKDPEIPDGCKHMLGSDP